MKKLIGKLIDWWAMIVTKWQWFWTDPKGIEIVIFVSMLIILFSLGVMLGQAIRGDTYILTGVRLP